MRSNKTLLSVKIMQDALSFIFHYYSGAGRQTEKLLSSAFDARSNKMAGLSDRAEMSLIVIRVVTSLYILAKSIISVP